MEMLKKFTIQLNSEEVEEIIKEYILKTQNLVIKDISFDIIKEYEYPMDDYGTHKVKTISCSGNL